MAQTNDTQLHVSDELGAALGRLKPQQAQAVIRIVLAELAGDSMRSLFIGPHPICTHTTYYRKKRGWVYRKDFQAALALARREIREQRLTDVVNDAIKELKLATPLAARDLRRQIAGDATAIEALHGIAANRKRSHEERIAAVQALARIGTPGASDAIMAVLDDPSDEVRREAIEALGAAAAGVDGPRRLADVAVLDRADKGTASKGVTPVDELANLDDSSLDQLIANLQAAIGSGVDVQAGPGG